LVTSGFLAAGKEHAVTAKDAPVGPPDDPGTTASEALLPEQSREDTDAGWGEYAQPDDDRLMRDRPPHWDDF
jgi:hypothetical protein